VTGDQLVEKGAGRLHELADRAAARGDGVGEWLSKELHDDAAFLSKLKPSLIKARAKGETPPDPAAPDVPSPPPAPAKPKKKGRGGVPPLAIVAGALVAGIVIAKVIDWRGHAHPRD
jgi:hypothetical protein